MWDLIVSVPDHCLSFTLLLLKLEKMFHYRSNVVLFAPETFILF